MAAPAVIERLSPRQGKILRYMAGTRIQPVHPESLVTLIEWSDLPHTDLQARKALSVLCRYGLAKKLDKNAYEVTDAGREVVAYADEQKMWQQPPPPEVTNKYLHRKDEQHK